MSELHLTDEILMAFADGELDEPVAAAVARAMAQDAAIAKRVVDFQQSRRLTRSAFSGALMPVPPALRAAVSAQVEAYEAKERRATVTAIGQERGRRRWAASLSLPIAMAASIALLAAGVASWVTWQGGRSAESLLARLEDPAIHRELDRASSGDEVALPFGRLRIISSYRLGSGALCREFRLTRATDTADAVACRRDGWNVAFALTGENADAGYVPSGGDDPMAAYLQRIGAGEPLVDEAEAKALMDKAR